jgi:alpha-tubulin suppressor-like RCC1 family protein
MKRLATYVAVGLALGACADDGGEDLAQDSAALIAQSSGARPDRTVAVGNLHVCVLTKTGKVRCWGRNQYGQLGDGTTTDRSSPVDVFGITNAVEVVAGAMHTCALLANGEVLCWGHNDKGQLGDGTTTNRLAPVTVGALDRVSDLAAGASHTCAVREGVVECWGFNDRGQLGNGTTTDSRVPVSGAAPTDFKEITAGDEHTCAVSAEGAGLCWGSDQFDQLGNGTKTDRNTPSSIGNVYPVRHMAAGAYHTCAIDWRGDVHCWGRNLYGAVGDGTTNDRLLPTKVLTKARAIAAGSDTTCATLAIDGTVKCWGVNDAGQVGNGSTSPSIVLHPTTVVGIDSAAEVELGGSPVDSFKGTTCYANASGNLGCWGFGHYGQMGNGTTTDTNLTPVAPSMGAAQIRAAVSIATEGKTVVVRPDGTARAWQWDAGASPAPTGFMAEYPTMVATTSKHSCALSSDGRVQCWGDNGDGQLGDGTTTARANPTDVTGLLGKLAVHVAVGNRTSCAVLVDGTVWCWGRGEALGQGAPIQFGVPTPTPVKVQGLPASALQVGVAGKTACALLMDGTVACWGPGKGAEGAWGGSTGSAGDPSKPVAARTGKLLGPAIAISSGMDSSGHDGHCALLSSGVVECWGAFPGNGSDYSDVPVKVLAGGKDRAVAVESGGDDSCIVLADGTVRCWGLNESGQLGQGFSSSPLKFPVPVANLGDVIAVSAAGGDGHDVCALTAASALFCWGADMGGPGVDLDAPHLVMTL